MESKNTKAPRHSEFWIASKSTLSSCHCSCYCIIETSKYRIEYSFEYQCYSFKVEPNIVKLYHLVYDHTLDSTLYQSETVQDRYKILDTVCLLKKFLSHTNCMQFMCLLCKLQCGYGRWVPSKRNKTVAGNAWCNHQGSWYVGKSPDWYSR